MRHGVDQGGRAFYNTEPLREVFLAERGAALGQTKYDKYFDLVGATSPVSEGAVNSRNAGYHYMRSEQGLPPAASRWDGRRWMLDEPLPKPWGHLEQGLHAKKVNEVLESGGLAPLTNPKIASFVENLRGNQTPVTIDRHNARIWGVQNLQGRPVDVPPRTGYGFLERLQQEQPFDREPWHGPQQLGSGGSRVIGFPKLGVTASQMGIVPRKPFRHAADRIEHIVIPLCLQQGGRSYFPKPAGWKWVAQQDLIQAT